MLLNTDCILFRRPLIGGKYPVPGIVLGTVAMLGCPGTGRTEAYCDDDGECIGSSRARILQLLGEAVLWRVSRILNLLKALLRRTQS